MGGLALGGWGISARVTSARGTLQVSPGAGRRSLTQVQPGSSKTSPERYYPNGRRTFVRLVPNDLRQAEGLTDWIVDRGADRLAIVHDDRLFGREMAAQVAASASGRRLAGGGYQEARPHDKSYADLPPKLAPEG